jgi:SagB-type dehydrogenase family enzyme
MKQEMTQRQRWFLSDRIRMMVDWRNTDQNRGIEPPPVEKPVPSGAKRIDLPGPEELTGLGEMSLREAISRRRSRRVFTDEPLTLRELSFLLWATQGVRRRAGPHAVFRTVPSAGCRHSFETYLVVMNVEDLQPGLYRYLPLEHQLVLLREDPDIPLELTNAALGQGFCARSAVTFVWTTVPYRMEWRYDLAAHRVIPLDAGHVGQNLYLASEAIGAGTCTIAAYDQEAMDSFLGIDGQEEFALYLAPVGKVRE